MAGPLLCLSFIAMARSMSIGHVLRGQHYDILEPFDDTAPLAHGIMTSPERSTLKLDCPSCPPFASGWSLNSTSLIFDFSINPDSAFSSAHIPLFLNHRQSQPATMYPENTPHTSSPAIPIPADTDISSYLWHPEEYTTTDLVTRVLPCFLSPDLDWDLHCLQITPTSIEYPPEASNNEESRTHDIPHGDVSTIQLFLRRHRPNTLTEEELLLEMRDPSDKAKTQDKYTIEWWRIIPTLLLDSEGDSKRYGLLSDDGSTTPLPQGLEDKLLGRHPKASASVRSAYWAHWGGRQWSIGPWNALQVWMLAAAVCAAFLALGWVTIALGRILVRRLRGDEHVIKGGRRKMRVNVSQWRGRGDGLLKI